MSMSTPERWLSVPGWEGFYEISSEGRLRGMPRNTRKSRMVKGGILRPYADRRGYLRFGLSRNGKQHGRFIHHLVLEAFAGARPDGSEARHLNGNRADNRAENLAWGTSGENKLDQVRHGTHPYANVTHCPQGHPYEGANLLVGADGARRCRTCRSIRERARRSRVTPSVSGEYHPRLTASAQEAIQVRVVAELRQRAWPNSELARRAQVNENTIRRLVRGAGIADETARKVAVALGVSFEVPAAEVPS